MTSRLTLTALVFAVVSTAALVGTAALQPSPAAVVRTVELERVIIVAPRLVAQL